ncbi:DUF302 domain-containing protein [soil metagenome]
MYTKLLSNYISFISLSLILGMATVNIRAVDRGFTSFSLSGAEGMGIVKVKSNNSFIETVSKLEAAIEANTALKIVAKIDHAANAKGIGHELRPTVLFIFGNPQMGTPLMSTSQTVALDLPQKMIVFEDEKGTTFVAYNDPEFIAQRHGIEKDHPAVKTAATGLANLATIASTK